MGKKLVDEIDSKGRISLPDGINKLVEGDRKDCFISPSLL